MTEEEALHKIYCAREKLDLGVRSDCETHLSKLRDLQVGRYPYKAQLTREAIEYLRENRHGTVQTQTDARLLYRIVTLRSLSTEFEIKSDRKLAERLHPSLKELDSRSTEITSILEQLRTECRRLAHSSGGEKSFRRFPGFLKQCRFDFGFLDFGWWTDLEPPRSDNLSDYQDYALAIGLEIENLEVESLILCMHAKGQKFYVPTPIHGFSQHIFYPVCPDANIGRPINITDAKHLVTADEFGELIAQEVPVRRVRYRPILPTWRSGFHPMQVNNGELLKSLISYYTFGGAAIG